jgi:hypothetical protein
MSMKQVAFALHIRGLYAPALDSYPLRGRRASQWLMRLT